MNINVHYNYNSVNLNSIITAIEILNGLQNYFRFIRTSSTIHENEKYLIWDEVAAELDNPINNYCIHIVDKPFLDNWFSHEESQYSVITTSDWNNHYSPPSLIAYLIYQIAQSAINFEANLAENQLLNFVHNNSEGCMFDFCAIKTDIRYGMRVGAICPTCKGILLQYGVNNDAICAIEKILDYVRLTSIGRAPKIDPNQVYIVKHYSTPSAIHNIFKCSVSKILNNFGFSALVGYQKMNEEHYFNSIINDISSSKMVVVLIDSTNPLFNQNAYIEYGLARGMNKDIIIICEKQFIDKLPTDLKGIKVVEYYENDFEGLEERLIISIKSLLNIQNGQLLETK